MVQARTIKRLPSGERLEGRLLDEAHGSELAPHALVNDGGRVGILSTCVTTARGRSFRQVRRAPLRRTDFEQFGYTDNCLSCANVRSGQKQAVDHSEQCRSRMESILMTTTEGHVRQERARDRFAPAAKEPGVEEAQRKRHRPEGEGGAASGATGIK